MAISKTTKGLFVSVLVLAIAVGIAHIAEAKVTVGKVQKVIQMPEGVFIEGPVFDKQGNLWFVEIGSGWISRITAKGKYEKFYDTGIQWGPNGMQMDRKGRLIICHRQLGLIALDPKTKRVKTIVKNYKGKKFNGP
ncbi:MAG: SMP-30/gluconolactonase/LRE family protein, partial [Deltaproteobacteria bacterium]